MEEAGWMEMEGGVEARAPGVLFVLVLQRAAPRFGRDVSPMSCGVGCL